MALQHKLSKRTEFVLPTFQSSINYSDHINIGSGTPDFTPPDNVLDVFKKSIDENQFSYTPWSGLDLLKTNISIKLKRENNITADPNSEILVTTGAQAAVMSIFMTILDEGDEVLIPSPYYSTYEEIARICGAKIIPIVTESSNNFTFDINQILPLLTDKTKAIILVSPNNPTATVLPEELVKGVCKIVKSKDLFLISDEIYEHYLFDNNSHYSVLSNNDMKDRTISIYSLSKGYGLTGIRVGYIVSNKDLIASIAPFHHAMSICAPVNSQYAAAEALIDDRGWFDAVNAILNVRRRMWMSTLDKLELPYGDPQGAYYICFDISKFNLPANEISSILKKDFKIIINPVDTNYLRGSLMQETETLKSGLQILTKFFKNL
jgi:aminotransferase